jgi:hypothetical protein
VVEIDVVTVIVGVAATSDTAVIVSPFTSDVRRRRADVDRQAGEQPAALDRVEPVRRRQRHRRSSSSWCRTRDDRVAVAEQQRVSCLRMSFSAP